MKRLLLLTINVVVSVIMINAAAGDADAHLRQRWSVDTSVVGSTGFERLTVNQGSDYSGPVVSTVVRKLNRDSRLGRAILYIHGFNDYFFQGEMADSFIARGYSFYAVDLRKYGRSLRPGQKLAQVRSFDEYLPDIDSALVTMKNDGMCEIALMGHSNGGLVVSYYYKRKLEQGLGDRLDDIKCLVLNSPFLDWNLGKLERVVPLLAGLGRWFPAINISQGGSGYSESLLKSRHGEWNYNCEWKRFNSTDVDLGWIRAVYEAQKFVRDKKWRIPVPVLVMRSAKSVEGDGWSPEFNEGDTVLDVDDIKKYEGCLGSDVTALVAVGGIHDLFLSKKGVRAAVIQYVARWLSRQFTASQALRGVKG